MSEKLTDFGRNAMTEEQLMKQAHHLLPSLVEQVRQEALKEGRSQQTALDYERQRTIDHHALSAEKSERDYVIQEKQNHRAHTLKLLGLGLIISLVIILCLIVSTMIIFGMNFDWFTVGLFAVFGGFAASIATIVR